MLGVDDGNHFIRRSRSQKQLSQQRTTPKHLNGRVSRDNHDVVFVVDHVQEHHDANLAVSMMLIISLLICACGR